MNQEIKVGDYVRNCKTRKSGHVSGVSPDGKRITVLTMKRTFASWTAKNVELIKDAKK